MNSHADPMRTVETICGARFLHQKLRLLADARELLDGPAFDAWLHDLFVLDGEDRVMDWLAESVPEPAVFLAKSLLQWGFYASDATDLREYADTVLEDLEAQTLAAIQSPSPLYHLVAHDGLLM